MKKEEDKYIREVLQKELYKHDRDEKEELIDWILAVIKEERARASGDTISALEDAVKDLPVDHVLAVNGLCEIRISGYIADKDLEEAINQVDRTLTN